MDHFKQWVSLLTEIGFSGLCDIAIVTLVIYTFLVALKRTRRSGLIFTGIVIVGAVYLAARKLNLLLTVALLQGFFAVILVALVVIFQEDLRYFFERVAAWWLERRLPLYKRKTARLPRREVEILARTLGDLARAKIGALVVIRGKDSIARHLDGGEEVKGLSQRAPAEKHFRSPLHRARRRGRHRRPSHRQTGLSPTLVHELREASSQRDPPRGRTGIVGAQRRVVSGGVRGTRHHLGRQAR